MARYLDVHASTKASGKWIAFMSVPIIKWWAHRPLSAIVGENCRAYVGWRTSTPIAMFKRNKARMVSERTARHELGTLKAAIRWYHAEYRLTCTLPTVTLPPKTPTREDYYIDRAEFERRLNVARSTPGLQHLERVLVIGWFSGTRPGAILRLRWLPSIDGGHIDLDNGLLYRAPIGAKRSNKRQPVCRIHRDLLPYLQQWNAADEARGISHVVTYRGRPVRLIRGAWQTLAGHRHDGPHVMRHSAATWLMRDGTVPVPEIASYLGMTVETLTAVYWHHSPHYQQNAASAGPMIGPIEQRNSE
jgi:integrase